MPVAIDVETIGKFSRLAKKATVLDALPPRLNENKNLYGTLSEELDLTLGSEEYKESSSTENDLDPLLDYILKTSKGGVALKESIDAEFITTPRILNALARSVYNNGNPLEIYASRQQDVIFLCEKEKNSEENSSISYLHKFKQYMTLDENQNPHKIHDKIQNKSTNVVNKLTLTSGNSGNFSLKVVYSSKVDAVDRDGNLLELKTTALGHNKWVEKQSLRHYLQAFLANVPYVIYGRRTNIQEQNIHKARAINTTRFLQPRSTEVEESCVDTIPTSSIPNYRVNWKKETCFEKLFNILQKIESKLEFDEDVMVVKVTKDGMECEENGEECYELVNPLFLNHFE
ncbi:hypothetical protein GCK72_016509 [Caenorhabditis remanei]|uniref:Decapping nuclease n=1 Tax=Caenorhabditis remanei TaxID=31234 RepID=A0A6A5G5U6_CAERE|nr:hypothetical protein GCK72_016509 [Caenorhabditis remanei]KAF1749964.1 hypothetical protein GCK72_016509 [Caenorhabditis remanei]